MTEAYPAVRSIVEKVIASGLIYLPSHARDFKNPEIDKYLARYVRGSNGIDYKERIKIMKLLWDAVGSEFGARHELYEMNYSGSHELVRLFPLQQAQASGALNEMEALAEQLHGRLRRGRLAPSGVSGPGGRVGGGEEIRPRGPVLPGSGATETVERGDPDCFASLATTPAGLDPAIPHAARKKEEGPSRPRRSATGAHGRF